MNRTIWAVLVVIIVLIGGFFIYNSMQTAPAQPAATNNTGTTVTTNTGTNPAAGTPASSVYVAASDPVKGTYMTDPAGKTLYTFDNDKIAGASSCTGACAIAWPPYTLGAGDSTLPPNVSAIMRADGTRQYAYNGKPLYYYAKDTVPGQLNGDGVGGTWHIIKL